MLATPPRLIGSSLASQSPTILVIDPLDASRESLRILLEDDGHRVLVARLASEGMDILDRTPVDLIVVDMLLRDGVVRTSAAASGPAIEPS